MNFHLFFPRVFPLFLIILNKITLAKYVILLLLLLYHYYIILNINYKLYNFNNKLNKNWLIRVIIKNSSSLIFTITKYA